MLHTYGAIFVLVPIAIFYCPIELRYWSYYLFLCMAFFWFGSTSFTSYQPMPLSDRMTLPLLPAFVILVAHAISRISVNWAIVRPDAFVAAGLAVGLFFLPLLTHVVEVLKRPRAEMKAVSVLKSEIGWNSDSPTLVLTSDSRSVESLKFFFGYRYPDNVTVAQAKQMAEIDQKYGDRIFVYQNLDRSRWLKVAYGIENSDSEIDSLRVSPIFQLVDVKLYRINHVLAHDIFRSAAASTIADTVP
jgi:hypothetical protein